MSIFVKIKNLFFCKTKARQEPCPPDQSADPLAEFEKQVRDANILMNGTIQVLEQQDFEILNFAERIVQTRQNLLLVAEKLFLAGYDRQRIAAVAAKFDSSPLRSLNEKVAAILQAGSKQ